MTPRLQAISGPFEGTVVPFATGFSLGRSESNDLRLPDQAVSPEHCTIHEHDGAYTLTDLDSNNGTFVNGVPVAHKVLRHGDLVRIGHSSFAFLLHDLLHEVNPPHPPFLPNEPTPSLQSIPLRFAPPDQQLAVPLGIDVGGMARDLVALFRIGNVINSIRDIDLLQRELLRLIFEVIPADSGAIVLLPKLEDESSVSTWSRNHGENLIAILEDSTPQYAFNDQHTKSAPNQPNSPPTIKIRRELIQRAIWEQSAIVTKSPDDSPTGSKSDPNVLCLPLIGFERAIGVIYLTCDLRQPPFSDDHVTFLTPVSRIAAVTLEGMLSLAALRTENFRLRNELSPARTLVGESRQMTQVEEFIARVGPSDVSVLIRGESGTGKELVARAIHGAGPRAGKPFIAINCAAIPETLIESELFGHEKGAFTGAIGTRKGKLEAAEDGTVFLDEIGEMPTPLQAKLLRVLQEREFERLGGTRPIPLKARVLAATNKNLEQAIKDGTFRGDLYYRLNVVSIAVPPLREHRDDIPLLALYFASKYAARNDRPFKGISREARALLMNYPWPGNVRELENSIEHAIVLGVTDEIIPEDLPAAILDELSAEHTGARYHTTLNQTKKDLVLSALNESNRSYPEAAKLLGIHPKYLHRLARTLNLKPDPPSDN
ncbi:MAG TPA: sigma 54-interacting transcriptional regulator [Acidisarcina sp.]